MKKILLVEDDAQLAENIADILILNGYVVCRAANGDKGQQMLVGYTPDIIISDVIMPGMNGLELVQLVKQDHRYRTIPVILISRKTTEKDAQIGKDAGANLYLNKPVDSDILIRSVAKLLRQKR
jgi:DNA-binding response OmpR family regulator